MKLRLQAIEIPNKPVFDFTGPIITMGRDAACDLPMTSMTNVSGRHAQLTLTPEGAFLLDLGSTNGTYLNDYRIAGRKQVNQGDIFRLGQSGPCLQVLELDLSSVGQPLSGRTVAEKLDHHLLARELNAKNLDAAAAAAPLAQPVARAVTAAPVAELVSPPPAAAPVATPVVAAVAAPVGQTRLMVVSLQKSNRNLMVGAGALCLVLLFVGGVAGLIVLYQVIKMHNLSSKTADLGDAAKKLEQKQEDLNQSVGKVAKNVGLPKKSLQELFAKLVPSVPWIIAYSDQGAATGTGFLVNHKGRLLVVTNRHVVEPGSKGLEVKFMRTTNEGKVEHLHVPADKAKLIAIHRKVDLAIIDVSRATDDLASWKIAPLTLAPLSHTPAVGEHVFAIGHPGDGAGGVLLRTLSDGIISSVGRADKDFGGTFIQVTVPVNWGNSGGPIFDDEGRIVAIATFIRRITKSGAALEALNFGLEIRYVHEILADPGQSFTDPEITAILQGGKKTAPNIQVFAAEIEQRYKGFAAQGYRPFGKDLAGSAIPFHLKGKSQSPLYTLPKLMVNEQIAVFAVSRGASEIGLHLFNTGKQQILEDIRPLPNPQISFRVPGNGDYYVNVDNITDNAADGFIVILAK